jgi:hypothetical protein
LTSDENAEVLVEEDVDVRYDRAPLPSSDKRRWSFSEMSRSEASPG